MAAKDFFHENVRAALEKEGWKITHDPLSIPGIGLSEFHIDFGAERLIGAEKNGDKIAVEVKSFLGASFSSEFHQALGQFNNYFIALEAEEPNRELFLAVPEQVFTDYFQTPHVQKVIERYSIKLIIFSEETSTIVSWKS